MKLVIIDADKILFTKDRGLPSVPECFKVKELREALETTIYFPRIVADCECELISTKSTREGDFSVPVTETAYVPCRYAIDETWKNYRMININAIYAESSLHNAEELPRAYKETKCS